MTRSSLYTEATRDRKAEYGKAPPSTKTGLGRAAKKAAAQERTSGTRSAEQMLKSPPRVPLRIASDRQPRDCPHGTSYLP